MLSSDRLRRRLTAAAPTWGRDRLDRTPAGAPPRRIAHALYPTQSIVVVTGQRFP